LATLTVDASAQFGFIASLEQNLRQRGVQRELHLRLANADCLKAFDPLSNSLLLTRLSLLPQAAEQVASLCALLAAGNRIRALSLISGTNTKDSLKALIKASPALEFLRCTAQSVENLPELLADSSSLRTLHLEKCGLRKGGLPLSSLLSLSSRLDRLILEEVRIWVDGAQDCAEAMHNTALCEIHFLRCPLLKSDLWPCHFRTGPCGPGTRIGPGTAPVDPAYLVSTPTWRAIHPASFRSQSGCLPGSCGRPQRRTASHHFPGASDAHGSGSAALDVRLSTVGLRLGWHGC
jgi:hypothetical protein